MEELVKSGDFAIAVLLLLGLIVGIVAEVDDYIRQRRKKKIFKDMEKRLESYGWTKRKEEEKNADI